MCLNTSKAQQLEGRFYGNNGTTYCFKDSTFKTVTPLHFAEKKIAKGTYTIKKNVLSMHFKPITNPPESNFEFISRAKRSAPPSSSLKDASGFNVRFEIVNTRGTPIEGAVLALYEKSDSTLMGFKSDSSGVFPELFMVNNSIRKFQFSFLGHEEFTMKADTLTGFNSDVRIILSDLATYSTFGGTKKYLIKESEKGRIVLQALEDDEKIILKRELMYL